MKLTATLSCLAVLAPLFAWPHAAEAPPAGKPPSLERIAQLAGTWVRVDEAGEATEQVVSSIRVTAGGSAVLETLFPGTDHEMITVYHQDGDELVLTHYCVQGNQPRMRARRDAPADKVVFECAGGGNMRSEDDRHMHQGTIHYKGRDRIAVAWRMLENGELVYTAEFDLVRKGQ